MHPCSRLSAFRDNVVVLTGASSGIGRELALQLASAGARLVLAARNVERLEEVADECERRAVQTFSASAVQEDGARGQGSGAGIQGPGIRDEIQNPESEIQNRFALRPVIVPTDVGDPGPCRSLIERAVVEFGRIDTLINNAGIGLLSRFDELTDLDQFERVLAVNLMGSVRCTFYALPHLIRSRGRIVVVSSLAGRIATPRQSAYCASKFALTGFFDTLRVEMGKHKVSVTVAYPGFVRTEFGERMVRGDGRPVGPEAQKKYHGHDVTARRCARIILKAAARRRRECVLSLRGRAALWGRLIAPHRTDQFVRRVVHDWR